MNIELTFKYDVSPTSGALELQFGEASNFLKVQGASHRHVATASDVSPTYVQGISTQHQHIADQVVIWTPPILDVHNPTHTHTSTTLTFDPASILSPLKNLDARQKHHARWHFIRLDFVYDQQLHDVIQNHVRLDFNPELPRHVNPAGFDTRTEFRWGMPSVANAAQAFYPVGLQQEQITRYGVHFVSPFFAQIILTWRSAPDDPATLPLLFDFQEGDTALPVHNARQLHKAQQCNVGVRIPLVVQTARHIQTAAPPALVHTSPLHNLDAQQVQTATQVRIRHTIPLTAIARTQHVHTVVHAYIVHRPLIRAHHVVQQQFATNIVVTHKTPLMINNGAQIIVSDQIEVRHWTPLTVANSRHVMSSVEVGFYVWSPLVLADTRHLMRSMRLNFLPADWIFRQVIDIEAALRELVLDPEDRNIALDAEVRLGVLLAEDRTLTIPAEIRTVELESIGRASPVEN